MVLCNKQKPYLPIPRLYLRRKTLDKYPIRFSLEVKCWNLEFWKIHEFSISSRESRMCQKIVLRTVLATWNVVGQPKILSGHHKSFQRWFWKSWKSWFFGVGNVKNTKTLKNIKNFGSSSIAKFCVCMRITYVDLLTKSFEIWSCFNFSFYGLNSLLPLMIPRRSLKRNS